MCVHVLFQKRQKHDHTGDTACCLLFVVACGWLAGCRQHDLHLLSQQEQAVLQHMQVGQVVRVPMSCCMHHRVYEGVAATYSV